MTVPANTNALLLRSVAPATYQVSRSLRFSSGDSSYLSRTPASAGNRKKWTWSGWVKRSALGTAQMLFNSDGGTSDSTFGHISFLANDRLRVAAYNLDWRDTSAVFRDVSAWYHIAVIFNTTETTASDRVKVFVNGTQVTQFATTNDPSLNTDYAINQVAAHNIARTYSSYSYFNGYLADIWFLDGIAATPSDFAETDATTGQWIPKAYTGSKGTNGFHLEFADNSAATATTLGKDTSGNSNNWTPNNLSVTAGAGNDSLVDTPTSVSATDTGIGGEIRGNYCTWNSAAPYSGSFLSNGNLDFANTSGTHRSAIGTIGVSSGKWYWEMSNVTDGNVGISSDASSTSTYVGDTAGSWGFTYLGTRYNSGSGTSGYPTFSNTDVIGLALNLDAGTLTLYKNGVSQGTAVSGLTGTWFPATGRTGQSSSSANFGQRAFAYTAPSGFKALCDTNLPTPVVAKPSTVMGIALRNGFGTSGGSVTSLGFSPDLIWEKPRNAANNHVLVNTVAGISNYLSSNTTSAELTDANYITSVTSSGYTIGNSDFSASSTIVSWCWDAGTSTVTNTQGSITSSVRANASAGFSIVSFNSGSNGQYTIGHGLNVAPALILCKARDSALDWQVFHVSATTTVYKYFWLNSTQAVNTDASKVWGDNLPTSTVFGFSTGNNQLANKNIICYCFSPVAGYSSFGSYTGNGSADGPFVYTGHRVKYLMIKRTDSTGDWFILDGVREPYNYVSRQLGANNSGAESGPDAYNVDFIANGFKIRNSVAGFNASAGSYVYIAFAENPFQYARAR